MQPVNGLVEVVSNGRSFPVFPRKVAMIDMVPFIVIFRIVLAPGSLVSVI